jgi:hypothetical protein
MKAYSLTKGEEEIPSGGEFFGKNVENVAQMCPTHEKGLTP